MAITLALSSIAMPAIAQETGGLRLPRIFGDGMVVQRGMPVTVWGWAAPGSAVRVRIGERSARATADAAGRWKAALPAMSAGGPHEIAVEQGATRIVLRDVLVGDVWVASGQSNMEWPLSQAADGPHFIAQAYDSRIRHFAVPHTWAEQPADDLAGGEWEAANPRTAGDFSAVAYFFARELRFEVDVPIGIVHASWGGSNVETWMSRGAHGLSDSAWAAMIAAERARHEGTRAALLARLGSLPTVDSGMVDGRAPWAAPDLDDSGWASIHVPGLWEGEGYEGLDGIAWYRTAFTLSEDEARSGVTIRLGMIDDDDVTWVNGTEIGRTSGYSLPRSYAVPPSALRAGRNVLAVRVADGTGGGGIYGDPSSVGIESGGARRPFEGAWRFRVGAATFGTDGQRINKIPSVLYNRMVHPLLAMPIRGVLWYQGESNANDDEQAAAYRAQFAELIRSWRREWTGTPGGFPFLWAQLPNFGAPDAAPSATAGWAILRESQSAALALPGTGQAVLIDVGEAGDIHPRNKVEVGRRLARVARAVVYGHEIESRGPTYRRHATRGDSIVIDFDHARGGLVSRAGRGEIGGFAIAGADRRWTWAKARMDGKRIVVWSDSISDPVAVRYAWANGPVGLTLYNQDGLPMEPFRTDRW